MSGHREIGKSDDTKYNIITQNEEKLLLWCADSPFSFIRLDSENSLILKKAISQ